VTGIKKNMLQNKEKYASKHEDEKIKSSTWILAFVVMLPTFMVALNTTVANVALTNIASGFAISTDDATWILTTYLVANGIILPTTSWFSNMFGRKKFLIICSIVFTFGSLLCGMSTSFSMMLIARIIQGLGGGALFPIAQTMLLESFYH